MESHIKAVDRSRGWKRKDLRGLNLIDNLEVVRCLGMCEKELLMG